MPQFLPLTSPDNPRIKHVVRLADRRERRKSNQFLAEGMRAITRGVRAGLRLLELYHCPDMGKQTSDELVRELLLDRGAPVALHSVTEPLMKKMTYCERPEGVIAVFEQPQVSMNDFPPARDGELWLVAVSLSKPGNLGAMARTADAAGATGMLVADGVVDAFNPNALRASTGAVLTLPIFSATTEDVLAFLAARNVRVVAASPEASHDYAHVNLLQSVALVIGAEDQGLDAQWRDAAARDGELVSIPMLGQSVDSLNASVAAGILLYEAVRQRQAASSK